MFKMKKMKEYTDNGDNYVEPEREFANDVLDIRVYCGHHDCKNYIKGREGYNGAFTSEDGFKMDLRYHAYICEAHKDFYKKLSDKLRKKYNF
jgi:hypothetical protein